MFLTDVFQEVVFPYYFSTIRPLVQTVPAQVTAAIVYRVLMSFQFMISSEGHIAFVTYE